MNFNSLFKKFLAFLLVISIMIFHIQSKKPTIFKCIERAIRKNSKILFFLANIAITIGVIHYYSYNNPMYSFRIQFSL